MVSDAFARVLRGRRAELNARFEEGRRRHPALDADAFAAFLRDGADPVVGSVATLRPDRAADAAGAAYDAAVDIIGRQIGGPAARHRVIDELWRRVLPRAAGPVAADPARVIPALTNAAHHVAGALGEGASAWVVAMERLAPQAPDADSLLALGQVAAWRAGLAHYRDGALAAAATLPEPLALAAVGAPEAARWSEVRERLAASPWFDPADGGAAAQLPRVAAVAGGFRGFGGAFVEPPRVGASGAHFGVRSGGDEWVLTADAFGATLHRVGSGDGAWRSSVPADLRVARGKVVWKGTPVAQAVWGEVTSAAANPTTLAFTAALTHGVIVVALA